MSSTMTTHDPESEGPYENGCHDELNDQVTLTIEHDWTLHTMMVCIFEQAKRDMNDRSWQPWHKPGASQQRFASDPVGVVKDALLSLLEIRSINLRASAWSAYRTAIGFENEANLYVQFAAKENKTDFNNWLYRRYNLWNLENKIQNEHKHTR